MDGSPSSPHWQQHLQPTLTQRLSRPLQRPGGAGTQVAESILSRVQHMTSGLPVAAQLLQRQASRERGEGMPIVYAQPMRGSGVEAASRGDRETGRQEGQQIVTSPTGSTANSSVSVQSGKTVIQRSTKRPITQPSPRTSSTSPPPPRPPSSISPTHNASPASTPKIFFPPAHSAAQTSSSNQSGKTVIQRSTKRPITQPSPRTSFTSPPPPRPLSSTSPTHNASSASTPKIFSPPAHSAAQTSSSNQSGKTVIQPSTKRPIVYLRPRTPKPFSNSHSSTLPYSPTPSKTPPTPTLIQRSPLSNASPPLPPTPTPKMKTPQPIVQRSVSDSDSPHPKNTEDQSLDIEDITDQVQQRLLKRMSVERERRGLTGW